MRALLVICALAAAARADKLAPRISRARTTAATSRVGSALRISWNFATVITVDYGVSREDSGLYINFNHIF